MKWTFHHKIPFVFLYPASKALIFFILCLSLTQCGFFEKTIENIGGVFKGNTRKDFTQYDLQDKREYRRYRYLKKVNKKEREKEILEYMKQNKDEKPKPKNR